MIHLTFDTSVVLGTGTHHPYRLPTVKHLDFFGEGYEGRDKSVQAVRVNPTAKKLC